MNNEQIHNEFKDGGLPINIPLPADAWNDMRKRLDDEMPVTGILLPGNVITAGTGFINGITALFALLLTGSIAWWFVANYTGVTAKNQQRSVTADSPNKKTGDSVTVSKTMPGNFDSANVANSMPATSYRGQNNNAKQVSATGKKSIIINSKPAAQNAAITVGAASSAIADYYKDSAKSSTLESTSNLAAKTATVASPASKHQASPPGDSTKEEERTVDKITVYAGLQWKSQVPLSGTQNYFTGPNASSQPYRVLLPGIWVGVEYDKSFLMGEINPFASTVYHPRPITALQQGDTKKLSKTFGISAALRYDYNFTGKWWAGGGIQAYWINKGIGFLRWDSLAGLNAVALTTDDWAYLSKFQVRTDAEVFYQSTRWHAGLRAGVYFTPIANSYSDLKNPLEVELFYRRILWTNRRKSKK